MASRLGLLLLLSLLRSYVCCYLAAAILLLPTQLFDGADGQLLPPAPETPEALSLHPGQPPPSTSPQQTASVTTTQLPQYEQTSEPQQPTFPSTMTSIGQSLAVTVRQTTGSVPFLNGSGVTQEPTQSAATGNASFPLTTGASPTADSASSISPVTLTNVTLLASSTLQPSTTAIYSSSAFSSPSSSSSPLSSLPSSSSASLSTSTSLSSSSSISAYFTSSILSTQPSSNQNLVSSAAIGQMTFQEILAPRSSTKGLTMQSTATSVAALAGPASTSSSQLTTFGDPAASSTSSSLSYLGCWSGSSFWTAEKTSFVNSTNTTVLNQTLVVEHCASSAAANGQARFIAIDDNLNCFVSWNDSVFTAAPTDSIASNYTSSQSSCLNVYDIYRGYQPVGCWLFALGAGIDNLTAYANAVPDDPPVAAVMPQDACGLVARLRGYAVFITQPNGSCFGARDPQLLIRGLTSYLGYCPDSQNTMSVYVLGEVPVNEDTQWSSWTSCSRGCGAGNTTRVRYRIKDNIPMQQMDDAVCNEQPCPWTADSPQWDGCWSSVPGSYRLLSLEKLMQSPADRNPATRQASVEKCAVLSYGAYLAFAVQGGLCFAIITDDVSLLYTNNASSAACPTFSQHASTGYDVYVFSAGPLPGSWAVWSPFDSCTVACGIGGSYTRKRTCSNPSSILGCPPGEPLDTHVKGCNNRPCPLSFNWTVNMGCYNVPPNYVELADPLLDGRPRTLRKDSFKKCAVVAFSMNYTVFGLTADNLCWTGPLFYCQLNQTGVEMTSCLPKQGLPQIMEVYRFQRADPGALDVSNVSSFAAATAASFSSLSFFTTDCLTKASVLAVTGQTETLATSSLVGAGSTSAPSTGSATSAAEHEASPSAEGAASSAAAVSTARANGASAAVPAATSSKAPTAATGVAASTSAAEIAGKTALLTTLAQFVTSTVSGIISTATAASTRGSSSTATASQQSVTSAVTMTVATASGTPLAGEAAAETSPGVARSSLGPLSSTLPSTNNASAVPASSDSAPVTLTPVPVPLPRQSSTAYSAAATNAVGTAVAVANQSSVAALAGVGSGGSSTVPALPGRVTLTNAPAAPSPAAATAATAAMVSLAQAAAAAASPTAAAAAATATVVATVAVTQSNHSTVEATRTLSGDTTQTSMHSSSVTSVLITGTAPTSQVGLKSSAAALTTLQASAAATAAVTAMPSSTVSASQSRTADGIPSSTAAKTAVAGTAGGGSSSSGSSSSGNADKASSSSGCHSPSAVTSAHPSATANNGSASEPPGGLASVVCPATSASPPSAQLASTVPSATGSRPTAAAIAPTPVPVESAAAETSSLHTDSMMVTSPAVLDQFGLPLTVHYGDAVAALNAAGLLAKQLSASDMSGKKLADFVSRLNSKLVLGNASEASSFLDGFAATLAAFTSTDMAPLWKKAPQYGGLMLQSAEEVALYCGSLVDNKTVTAPNVVMQVITISSNRSSPVLLTFDSLSLTAPTSLTIPAEVFAAAAGSPVTAAAIQLENFTSALSSSEVSNRSSTLNGTLLPGVLSIRTNVMAPNTILSEQVVVRMAYNSTGVGSNMSATCVFWNVTAEQWSTDGCLTVAASAEVECHCNHLTSFAVLMRVDNYEPDGYTATALTYISYIGCGISVACLIATFGVLLYLNNLKTDKKIIHMNLVVSLGVAQVTHISGINLTSDAITCTVIAAMLHFFYMTAFFWMLCEGLHLYLKVVAVFNSENASKRIIYYLIGYVCPAVIVGTSVGIRHDGYGNTKFCWLSTDDGLIWAFIGPVCAIILCNIVILCIVMKIVISTAATIPNKKKKDFQLARTGIKGVMILMPLLGVSWLLGLLAVNSSTLVFEFLFVIINSTQGLFIFLFHCVGSSEVRSAFRRKRDQSSRSKDGKRSSVVQSVNDPNTNNNNRTAKDGIAILVEDPRFPVLYLNNFQADGQKVPLTIESAIDGLLNGTLGLNVGGYKHAVPEDVDVVDINSCYKSAVDVTEAYDDEIDNDIDEDIISAELAEVSQDDLIGDCLKTVDRSMTLGSREQTRLDMSNCERKSALSTGQLREASAQTRLSTARRVTSAGARRSAPTVDFSPAVEGAGLQAARTISIQTSSGIGSSLSLDSSWEDEIIESMLAERPQTAAVSRPKSQEHKSRLGSANARLSDLPQTNKSSLEGSTESEETASGARGTRYGSSKLSGSALARSPTVSVSSTSLRNRSGKRSAKVSPSPMPVEDDDGRASTAMADDGKTTPAQQHPFRLTSVSEDAK